VAVYSTSVVLPAREPSSDVDEELEGLGERAALIKRDARHASASSFDNPMRTRQWMLAGTPVVLSKTAHVPVGSSISANLSFNTAAPTGFRRQQSDQMKIIPPASCNEACDLNAN
jgi:hypothetical protein